MPERPLVHIGEPSMTFRDEDERARHTETDSLEAAQAEYRTNMPSSADEILAFFSDKAENMEKYIHLLYYVSGLLRQYADNLQNGHTMNAQHMLESGFIPEDIKGNAELALDVIARLQHIARQYSK